MYSSPDRSHRKPSHIETLTDKNKHDDMQSLLDDRGEVKFSEISDESFGASVLKSYGWSPGDVIGRNKKNAPSTQPPLEPTTRKRYGLDFQPYTDKKPKRVELFSKAKVRLVSGRFRGREATIFRSLDGKECLFRVTTDDGSKFRLKNCTYVECGSAEEKEFLRSYKVLENLENDSNAKANVRPGWLMRHIRVKVVSKELRGGNFYMKKGLVIDVVEPEMCDVAMDEGGEVLQGVNEGMLDIAHPREGQFVLAVCGENKGIYGRLVGRFVEEGVGFVREAETLQLIRVGLDEIAEYRGDPEEIGY